MLIHKGLSLAFFPSFPLPQDLLLRSFHDPDEKFQFRQTEAETHVDKGGRILTPVSY